MRSRQTCLLGVAGLACLLMLTMGGCDGVEDAEAAKEFNAKLGDMTVTVFPAYVRETHPHYDAAESAKIADFLRSEGHATCTLSEAEVPIAGDWGKNQAKMFRNSLKSFQEYLAAYPIDTDYALLPEYLMGRDSVGGVHVYVVARDGRVPYGTGANSHHPEFKAVDPKTAADATEVAIRRMRNELQERAGERAKAKLGTDTALTIYPVVMAGGPRKDVADVIGLMLEREGMKAHVTTETQYTPSTECTPAELGAGFSQFIRQNPPETEYALCVEFCGTPQSGPTEIRNVLVTRTGTVLWTDVQTPNDRDFKRIKPDCPMTCCVLATERLKPKFGLGGLFGPKQTSHRFEQLWQKSSNTPDEAEFAAMKQRLETLRKSAATARVLVYPPRLDEDVDRECAEHLVELLEAQGLANAVAASTDVHFEIAGSSNEQRVLWNFARAVQQHVQANPPDAEYALFADYLAGPDHVGAVHFVICDRAGDWVLVDFQNSHHDDFNQIAPQNRSDCDRLVARRLRHHLH